MVEFLGEPRRNSGVGACGYVVHPYSPVGTCITFNDGRDVSTVTCTSYCLYDHFIEQEF